MKHNHIYHFAPWQQYSKQYGAKTAPGLVKIRQKESCLQGYVQCYSCSLGFSDIFCISWCAVRLSLRLFEDKFLDVLIKTVTKVMHVFIKYIQTYKIYNMLNI